MSELRELYQEVILDHSKKPRNRRRPETVYRKAEGHNPLCGDRVTVYVSVEDGEIRDVSFEGSGCAISTASASMMTEILKGKSVEQARAIFERFHDLVMGRGDRPRDDELGKLAVFAGVRDFPIRVKCATLPWHTVRAALDTEDETVTTE